MFTVHVISDLNLLYNEFTPETEFNIPEVDLVVINGNIGYATKRSMLYVEQLCNRYPETQFVYNYGFAEFFSKGFIHKGNENRFEIMQQRDSLNPNFPKNLVRLYRNHAVFNTKGGDCIDIFCAFGYPKIHAFKGKWEDHVWHRNVVIDVTEDINDSRVIVPKDSSRVNHGYLPIWATQEWMSEQNKIEYELIRNWELNVRVGRKVLVTHINPIEDSRCKNQTVSFFDIHLNNGLWIGSDTKINNTMYLGAKFVSNPGRGSEARSLVIKM